MNRILSVLAALLMVCSPALFAARIGQNPGEQPRLASHASPEKSVLLKYDLATAAVTALADMHSLNNVIDMDPVHALRGPYAVIVTGDGSSFIVPAPTMRKASELLVLVPFSVKWDVQSITVTNLPGAETAARTFTVDGDLLLSKTDIAAANAVPSFKPHQFRPRPEWCFEPSDSSDNKFPVSGGGSVCVTCISCADGSWEICGSFYSC
jgi:hypothetical protein